jgi:hypothetical protein
VGPDPFAQGRPPPEVSHVESLGSYLVLTFRAESKRLKTREARCAAASLILRKLAGVKDAYVFHPHPVTPYHEDYLQHFDVAQSAKQAALSGPPAGQGPASLGLRWRAQGQLPGRLARSLGRAGREAWDATIAEEPADALLASRAGGVNGWPGPPWLKQGWFHAYLLLAEAIRDRARKAQVEDIRQRLAGGAYDGLEEQLNLERQLVSLLAAGCERVVVGYTVERAHFNADFSAGIENVGYDSHGAFLSPVFPRTVKLKDFPWNGWLRLGVEARPLSAWNPIGGFGDPAGRLIWSAAGDPALLPPPYGGEWIANRIAAASVIRPAVPGGVPVPRDALGPEPGSGAFGPLGDRQTARLKIVYRVLTSAFHDDSRMSAADAIYPFSFAFRWGTRPARPGAPYDPLVDEATAAIRRALVGFKIVRVEKEVRDLGELRIVREIPVIEVYLRAAPVDPSQAAALAPPWSSLPWHLAVLMEEAVARGAAAFSADEAKRRGVPWLDLVRDPRLGARLAALVEEFERRGYLPDALKELVAPHEATLRWSALKRFFRERGHFLVTNGPFQLAKWSEGSAVLQVWRDLSYPLGVGAFDRYALPLQASVARIEARPGGLRISAEVERAERAQRSTTVVRVPLTGTPGDGVDQPRVACRYVVVGPGGDVLRAGTVAPGKDGTFSLDLQGLPAGEHTVLTGLSQNGNHVRVDARAVRFRAPGSPRPIRP